MNVKIKGLKELEKNLKNMQKKVDKYSGTTKVSLPYSEEQWETMSEYQKNQAVEKAKDEYIEKIKNDLFN